MKVSGDCSEAACGRLSDLIAVHAELFQAAHGAIMVRPKHHMAFHLPDQYLADGVYMDCFPMERRQKLLKAIVEHMNNTSSSHYEFHALSKAL